MKWILAAVAGLAALAGAMTAIGAALPVNHVASVEAQLPVQPERIWDALTDIEAYPSWRSDIERVERQTDGTGRVRWVEHSSSGRLTFAFDRADAPHLLVTRIADPDLPFGGTWTFEIGPAPGGSALRITERGEIYNPFFRFMARFGFGYERTLETYLADLQRHLGR